MSGAVTVTVIAAEACTFLGDDADAVAMIVTLRVIIVVDVNMFIFPLT
jgi:hypothetical protein